MADTDKTIIVCQAIKEFFFSGAQAQGACNRHQLKGSSVSRYQSSTRCNALFPNKEEQKEVNLVNLESNFWMGAEDMCASNITIM